MTTFYYHVTNKEALAKVAELKAERERIRQLVTDYCQQFAMPDHPIKKVNFYSEHYHFAGVVFAKEMPTTSWCVPTKNGHQSPRVKLNIKGATAEQKEAHADLLKRWEAIPKDSVNMNEVFIALIGVGNDFMSRGSAREATDGSYYVEYTRPATRTDGVQELLGSAYDRVIRELDALKKGNQS